MTLQRVMFDKLFIALLSPGLAAWGKAGGQRSGSSKCLNPDVLPIAAALDERRLSAVLTNHQQTRIIDCVKVYVPLDN